MGKKDGSRNVKGSGKRVAELGKDLGESVRDVLGNAQRKKILKKMWDALEGGGLSAREQLSYMQEISKLEAFQKDRESDTVYNVVLRVGGFRVVCGECGNEILVQDIEGEKVCVRGGEVV